MADDELTYEDVVDVWEREKDSEQPCDLPDNFYQRLREYIQDLEEKTEDIGISPSNKKEKRMQKQYERVKKIADLFFKKRQKKIVLAAYHKSLGQSVNTSNLIDRELQLLNEVSNLLKELKNLVFLGEYKRKTTEDREGKSRDKEEEMSGEDSEESKDAEEKGVEETVHKDQSGKEKSVSGGKEKEKDESVETDETVREKVEAHEEILVHIIDDVPPFVDLDTSYELNKEDVVTLHEDIAKVLIERGKARKIKL
ncbi:MAG: hypothetical protein V5A88_03595 [Candidatus Thermoplasmatota archaeon]